MDSELNLFWDQKLDKKEVAGILADENHERFSELAALLLSRTNDVRLVFLNYLTKLAFCRNWKRIKAAMKRNKWAADRVDYWDQIHRVVYAKLGNTMKKQKSLSRAKIPELKSFSEVLKAERIKNGMTQKEIAKVTGLSQQTISHIETGYWDYSFSSFKKLADALNLRLTFVTSSTKMV